MSTEYSVTPSVPPFEMADPLGKNVNNLTFCSDIVFQEVCPDYQLQGDGSYTVYNFFIVIIFVPVIAAFGVVSNLINIFLFSQSALRKKSGNVYLLGIACSDLLVVFSGMFLIWMDSARSYVRWLNKIFVDAFPVLAFAHISHTCSVYFTVAAAFDNYLKVCQPERAQSMCTYRRAVRTAIFITVICVGYNLVRFWQFETEPCFDDVLMRVRRVVCMTRVYAVTANIYNVYMSAMVMTFLPFLLLSIVNTLIMRRVKTQQAIKNFIRSTTADLGAEHEEDTIITMVMVVLLFLFCNVLSLIIGISENFVSSEQEYFHYMSDMSSLLVMFNSSVNIIIYVRFERDYRRLLIYYFCCLSDALVLHEGETLKGLLGIPFVVRAKEGSSVHSQQQRRYALRALLSNGGSDSLRLSQTVDSQLNEMVMVPLATLECDDLSARSPATARRA